VSAGAGSSHCPKSILIVRLGAMGDIVHTFPAASTLRRAFPAAQLGWMVEERWADLLCAPGNPRLGPRTPARPLVDSVYVVNTKAWRKSPLSSDTRHQFSSALKEVRDQKYEIAIDFQGAIKSALLTRLSAAATVIGMQRPREAPARMFYARQVPTKGTHVIEQYQSLAASVVDGFGGCAPSPDRQPPEVAVPEATSFDFPQDDAAEASLAHKLQNGRNRIVLINPGAGWGAKQWQPERYGEVARVLANEGFSCILNYGPGEESLVRAIQEASGGTAQAMNFSISELIAVTRRASLFIGGDTGPLHLAAALGVPVVAIFGPTDPARNGPYSNRSIVLRNASSRTSLSHTSAADPGLLRITSEEVLSAAHRLLESPSA
jgi:heptosyltransferase-1